MLSKKPVKCPNFLLEKARSAGPVKTAVANPTTISSMEGVKLAFEQSIIEPIFVGDIKEITLSAKELSWDISSFSFYETSVGKDCARKTAELASDGVASAIMKGHIDTVVLLKSILDKEVDLVKNTFLSHIFYMTIEGSDKAIMITDGVLNVSPNQDVKKGILRNAVSFARKLSYERPQVALLSATEKAIKSVPSSIDADELSKWAKGNIPDADVYGPLALDNAVSKQAALIKKISNPVAGNADILLVPNLETGNALFKLMIYFLSACAAGLVLGARVPIILNSRSDPPEAHLASAALAGITM